MNAADPQAHVAPQAESLHAANIRNLTKAMGGEPVLRQMDWSIPAGRVIGLLGRNGSGKTTLLECLLGLRAPDFGEIRLFGETPRELSDATKARLGYVPQQSELFEWMTARDMLAFIGRHYARWEVDKVNALLDRWSVAPDRIISRLSVGEKQKLSIIRALGHSPDFLVLDEPVASLDPAARREFLREVVSLSLDHDATVLFSTHILTDLERVAFDVAVLHGGKILLEGPLDRLAEEVVRVRGPVEALSQAKAWAIGPWRPDAEKGVLVRLPDPALATEAGLKVEALSLEDMFIEVTQ